MARIQDLLVKQVFFVTNYRIYFISIKDYLMEWYSNRHHKCVRQENMDIYGLPFSSNCLNPFDWVILITSIGQICAVYAFCYFFNRLLNVVQQVRNV